MKRIALLISLFVVTTVFAGNENSVLPVKKNLHPKLFRAERTVWLPDVSDCLKGNLRMQEEHSAKMKVEAKPVHKEIERPGGWLEMGRTGLRRAESGKLQVDSFVVTEHPSGQKLNCDMFEYNEDGWVVRRKPCKWDANTNAWTSVKEYVFERDDEGYITTQYANNLINDGINSQRVDYVYNEKKLGISQTFQRKMEDGEWHYIERGEYKYDDRGNIIEELAFMYNEDTKGWDKVQLFQAEYDEHDRQLWFADYAWDGTDWQGMQKKGFGYTEDGTTNLWTDFQWMPDTKDWLLFYQFVRTYDENGLWVKDEEKYWNPDKQDWNGCYDWGKGVLYCTISDLAYDDKGRETSQQFFKLDEDGWKKKTAIETEWSVLENGDNCSIRRHYFYDDNGIDRTLRREDEYHDNSNGMRLYEHNRKTADGGKTWTSAWEFIYEYLDGKYLEYGESYQFDPETGQLLSAINERYEYDGDHNVTRSTYGTLLSQEGGENIWGNNTDFTYKYEQGIRTEKLAYRWDGTEYVKNWGEGWTWDFDVPVSNLVVGDLATVDWPCKMDESYSYYPLNDEWAYQKGTYYWSEVGGETAIEEATKPVVSFSPNPVTDMLYIHADAEVEVVLYNMQGVCLLTAQTNQIDMSTYLPGLYIIEVNGVKTKVIKE